MRSKTSLEYAPYEEQSLHEILEPAASNEDGQCGDPAVTFMREKLRKAGPSDLLKLLPKLPVYPPVALTVFRLLSSDNVHLGDLERLTRRDQVLAGNLIRAANSTLFHSAHPIRTISHAFSYLGTETAKRLLLACAVQPLFSSSRLRQLWKHSVESAQIAEQLAILSERVDPQEAFLAGLLHDVGKLVIALLPAQVGAANERLLRAGVQSAAAEVVLCGFDHAQAGAEALRFWNFPSDMVEAVRSHHQPERSDSILGPILYLSEFWLDVEEDLPSTARLHIAMERTGITPAMLDTARPKPTGSLSGLLRTA